MKKGIKIFLIIILILIIIWFFIRLTSSREIDDVTPGISCEDEKKYVEKADILWVVPNFQNYKISENPEWCGEILSLNKTLGMHGIKHTYREFRRENITQEELEEGMKIFEECFGYNPEIFKYPQLRYNKENRELLKENGLKIRTKFSQFTHKVYHCDNGGISPKDYKITDIFRGIIDNRVADIL
ncbi:MAG: DUF2334 domain-containing protein [Nanoarchaeota archaeon]|nr:DUF2334 domain-containing protein [Nanoarchaeota archaeon]